MMTEMCSVHRLVLALGLFAIGCAHTTETREASSTLASAPETREVVAVDEPPPLEADRAPSRPRLARTITLGRANDDPTYSGAPPPESTSRGAAGSNVIVQNQVIVQQAPGLPYGGYGYGYGARGYGARGYGARGSRFGTSGAGGAWGSNGFEGARRTAPAGHTPHVGGNWPSAPSHGPASMR